MKTRPIELHDEDRLNVSFKDGMLEIRLCGDLILKTSFAENNFDISLLFSLPPQYHGRE